MVKYYCSKCNRFHLKGKLFKLHKEFDIKLTQSQIWSLNFKKSLKNYSIKQHQKTGGSNKQ